MGKNKFKQTLLSGVAAAALLVGASNLSPARAEGAWQGFYVGADIGWGGANFDGLNNGPASNTSVAVGDTIDGIIGSGHIGYNFQDDSMVYGIEADLAFPDWKEYQPGGALNTGSITGITDSVDLLASIRGRLGYVTENDLLIFGTAGLAFVDAQHRIWGSRSWDDFADFDLGGVGYVVGAGLEWRPDDWYSLRVQGLYYGFNEHVNTSGVPGFGGTTDTGDFGELNGAFAFKVGISFNLHRVADMMNKGGS